MIPLTIHQIWLNDGELPTDVRHSVASWSIHAPQFTHQLWTQAKLREHYAVELDHPGHARAVSNLLRVRILNDFGGVYVDADTFAQPGAGEELAAVCVNARLLGVAVNSHAIECDNTPMGAAPRLAGFERLTLDPARLMKHWNAYLATSRIPFVMLSGRWWNAPHAGEGVRIVHRRNSLRQFEQPAGASNVV